MADNQQSGEEKPKIIVDDDWKTQAQAEKEKLAEEVEKKAAQNADHMSAAAAASGDEEGQAGQRDLPPASFNTLVSSLVTQVVMALGGVVDPQSGKRYLDPELAKFHIDTLSVLEEKTKGNLEDDEKQLIDRALYETRMQYVQVSQAIANAAREQGPSGETPNA